MIVKRLLILLFFAMPLFSQPLNGLKFCIDPGHGGYDPANDRYIPQTGFWESASNWEKALHTKEILERFGAVVILTRDGNDDSDDLPLSQRAAIANANNVDFFNSIHSNGFQGTANSTLLLFRGYDNAPVFPQAKVFGSILVQKIYQAHRTTGTSNRGDWSFYPEWGTSGLGVLRTLNMPGTLSEGSFHDYIPESWRLMNSSYRRHEAWAINRAFFQFYSAGTVTYGALAGLVRDPLENVSYYYIPTTSDAKKPVNYINITLQPGGLIYSGDDKNNGFFLFDSLNPGQYKIFYEAENYKLDSTVVNVSANSTVFADKYLDLVPNLDPPAVLSHSPLEGEESVSLRSQIEIVFDIRMNTQKVQAAFYTSPPLQGSFSWSDNNKKMTFTPNNLMLAGKEYTVNVSSNAESYFGIKMADDYSFRFTTRSKLSLMASYPDFYQQDISRTVQIILKFDAPIDPFSLPGNIGLYDSGGNTVSVSVNTQAYADGDIIFEPQQPLSPNSFYGIVLKEGIGDTEELSLGENIDINFLTEKEVYLSGSVIENFENFTGWIEPGVNPNSQGIDPQLTAFSSSARRRVNGNYSGRLFYFFTETDGKCVIENTVPYNLGSDPESNFGIWIFGDNSGNIIEYQFTNNQNISVSSPIGNIDWTGWKIKYLRLGDTGLEGNYLFKAVSVKRTESGSQSGELYFDDIQVDVLTPLKNESPVVYTGFVLNQNYPNPFNPSTSISFNLPAEGIVNLIIYDILGREIGKLIDGRFMKEGNYSVYFDTRNGEFSDASSGIYIYTLTSGNFRDTKKMLLIK